MEVSNNINNYQMLSTQQKPVTTPVEPQDPKYTNGEIYEASDGNVIREDGELTLTPQGENNLNSVNVENEAEEDAAAVAQADAQRETATNYLAHQSKKSQVEIYLAVATDGNVEVGSNNDTVSIIESLRDVQKQNNAVAAYATYQENQNSAKPELY